jgi:pimeloyl-ACP methyl ester carboxylesterase
MMQRILFLVFLLAGWLVQGSTLRAQSPLPPRFEPAECPFLLLDPRGVECGYLSVPENRGDPNSHTIQLAVAIFRSTNLHPAPDPLIYLDGGPGGSPLAYAGYFFDFPVRAQRDVIVFDQRGTGFSLPSLDCPGLEEAEDYAAEETACYHRLVEQGIDLTAYNSRESAADVVDLWQTLGYETVNIYGVSYGTRLALTVMRYHPDGIRSVILDGVFPPQVNGEEEDVLNFYGVFSALLEDCAADPVCNEAYPRLEARFYAMLAPMFEEPVYAIDPETGEETELYAPDIVSTLYDQMYITEILPFVPMAIDAAAEGDFDSFLEIIYYGAEAEENDPASMTLEDAVYEAEYLLDELTDDEYADLKELVAEGNTTGIADYLYELFEGDYPYFEKVAKALLVMLDEDAPDTSLNDGDSVGMFNAVTCHEETVFEDINRAAELADAAGVPHDLTDSLVSTDMWDTCAVWQTGQADPLENQPVVSDIPTLLMSGEYDPATPPHWGELAAETLSHSTHIIIPGAGHSVIDVDACPLGIALAFLDDPNAALDTSCVATLSFRFVIE